MNTTIKDYDTENEFYPLSGASGATEFENGTCLEESVSNTSLLQTLIDSCEASSTSNHMCFWNRQSRITGRYCSECLGVCLSKQKSHNIYQFSIGALFLAIAATIGYVFVSAIASDITSISSQVCIVLRSVVLRHFTAAVCQCLTLCVMLCIYATSICKFSLSLKGKCFKPYTSFRVSIKSTNTILG